MIEVNHLTKRYGDFKAVDDVNLVAESGKITILLGPNGAGKSTTIKSIANLLKFEGDIRICSYPNDTIEAKRKLFPFRNRIISGLSNSLLVTQARQKSGTMITAGYALEQGKEVYCIPGRYDDYNGCNELIKQGAKMVTNVLDIIDDEDLG